MVNGDWLSVWLAFPSAGAFLVGVLDAHALEGGVQMPGDRTDQGVSRGHRADADAGRGAMVGGRPT